MIVGVEKVATKSRNGERFGFAAARRNRDDEHHGHLAAEVTVGIFPHIFGKSFAHAPPGPIGHTEALQLERRRRNPLVDAL